MDNSVIYIILLVVAAILFIMFAQNKKEGLSLSQFPVPTCSTCKSCKFYTCGKCGTVYQEQNKVGQTCDCGGFNVYRTPVQPSCYDQTLKGFPDVGPVQTCKEPFRLPHVQPKIKGSCQSCSKNEYTCLEAAGTFDSGSTFLRNLPCPAPFPPVVSGLEPTAQKQLRHVSELDVYKHLEQGGLIVAANNGNVIDYIMKKLMEATAAAGAQGYPNFYYIDGPVLVMSKVGKNYFWMIDYPIKYNPENFPNYVNTSTNWNIAKTAYQAGRKLLNLDAPVIFFSADQAAQFQLRAAAFACLPDGAPESNTDYYYPGCTSKSCLWGPDYGAGNWLMQV
ncbi:hypothetical protein LCGC14_2006910 [marine sediment metagenome]|uniref:Uncharacterized protein n=1 Tax=marine sediment metagenome TaxID=412755 RepID=A0A0F9HEV4_9ZZZZ